uniref:hypothetical protein n=1 Tax=Thalassolituus oleivorans TaxID=187493 RepID=UPI0023F16A11
ILILLVLFFFDIRRGWKFPYYQDVWLFFVFVFVFVVFVSVFDSIYLNYLVKISVIFICMLVYSGLLMREEAESTLVRVLFFYSIFHFSVFYLQFVLSNFFGYYLDIDSMIREQATASLHETKALDMLWFKSRGGGVFSEPSFYAMAVSPAVLFYTVLKERIDAVSILGFGSVLLSFSIAAMGVLFVIYLLLFVQGVVSRKQLIVAILASSFLWPSLYQVYDLRVNQAVDYDPVESRSYIFDELSARSFGDSVFGVGFIWNDDDVPGDIMLTGAEIRDSSFYPYLLFCSGFFGFFVFFAFISIFFRKDFRVLVFLLAIFLFKFHFVNATLWMALLFAVLSQKVRLQR